MPYLYNGEKTKFLKLASSKKHKILGVMNTPALNEKFPYMDKVD